MGNKKNTILIEKFESRPGIYAIFNTKTEKIYIGKASNLKRRMVQHVRKLFEGADNNFELQNEFNKGNRTYRIGLVELIDERLSGDELEKELDKCESIYYLTALKMYGKKKVYNKQELRNEMELIENETKEFLFAKAKIKDVISRKENDNGINKYRDSINKKVTIQDWVGIPKEELEKDANNFIKELSDATTKKCMLPRIKVDQVRVKDFYENNKLDFMLIGKMGDYVNINEQNQTFTDILTEKIADIGYYGKCLWATSGPNPNSFRFYRKKFDNQEKSIYALFSLTVSEYKEEKQGYYSWDDSISNSKLFCTAPKGRKHFKALVIKKLMLVEEDFLKQDFNDLFYQAEVVANDRRTKRLELPKSLNEVPRATLLKAFSKKVIWKRKDVQELLGLEGELFERFKLENPIIEFPESSDESHLSTYYILAEVEDYVDIKECSELDEVEDLYKKFHPYSNKREQ